MRVWLFAVLGLFLLTACDSTRALRELKYATPSSDPFRAEAAAQYQRYSEELMGQHAWWTSKYFADKGLLIAYDQNVEPEDPAIWSLPAETLTEFQQARAHLIAALAEHASHDPETAALALVAYDRWVEIQNNN